MLGVERSATDRRDQEGVPPQGARAAPRRELGARRRGALQGGQRGLRRAVRPPEAADSTTATGPCRARPAARDRGRGFSGPGEDFFGFDMADLFSAFFGGVYGGGRGSRIRREGRDMALDHPSRSRRPRVERTRRSCSTASRPATCAADRADRGRPRRHVPRVPRERSEGHDAPDVPRHHADDDPVRPLRRNRADHREPVRGVPGLGPGPGPPARQGTRTRRYPRRTADPGTRDGRGGHTGCGSR